MLTAVDPGRPRRYTAPALDELRKETKTYSVLSIIEENEKLGSGSPLLKMTVATILSRTSAL